MCKKINKTPFLTQKNELLVLDMLMGKKGKKKKKFSWWALSVKIKLLCWHAGIARQLKFSDFDHVHCIFSWRKCRLTSFFKRKEIKKYQMIIDKYKKKKKKQPYLFWVKVAATPPSFSSILFSSPYHVCFHRLVRPLPHHLLRLDHRSTAALLGKEVWELM